MLQPSALPRFRRLMIVIALVLSAGMLAVAMQVALQSRPADRPHGAAGSVASTVGAPPASAVDAPATSIPRTDNAEQFTRDVAIAIFTWDTGAALGPVEMTEPFLAVADPTGESSASLVSDLANYLPTPEAWANLRPYQTRQWLTVTSVSVPSLWATAREQAGDELLPGTNAHTVRGVRHRSGVWNDDTVTSEHDVSFTVFTVCRPSYAQCHLLRLSRLDDPLK